MDARDPSTWTLDQWRKVAEYVGWRPRCPACTAPTVVVEVFDAPAVVQAKCKVCGHEQQIRNCGFEVFELVSTWHREISRPQG